MALVKWRWLALVDWRWLALVGWLSLVGRCWLATDGVGVGLACFREGLAREAGREEVVRRTARGLDLGDVPCCGERKALS